ncbi:biotin transport system substrate-specific component [Isoptericola variabilis J7]|uniref:Biotin transporter n=2 Tax=Isoptericola TaxID=254250 RepID=F6FS61_ISOV2|nr:BioY protein [Isoptericola variabilis 225]TWH31450.1 biotin transport system substrate-specific component [Isoptericola variabilis J7]
MSVPDAGPSVVAMTSAALPLPTARPRRVLADVLPGTLVRDVALVVGVAALTALTAQLRIPIPGLPVPVTGQTFAVLLGAAALGPLRGSLAQVLYVGVGLAGLPVFTGGASGWEAVAGASGGYLLGFVAASAAVGALARRGADRRVLSTVGAYAVGTAVIYACGVPWLAAVAGMPIGAALMAGAVVFLPGDAIKAAIAGALLPAVWRRVR